MKGIDAKWDGTVKLQQACIDNQEFMDRFEELYRDHEAAVFKTYEMYTMCKDIWVTKWVVPWMLHSSMMKIKAANKDNAEVCEKKLLTIDTGYFTNIADYEKSKQVNDQKASDIL